MNRLLLFLFVGVVAFGLIHGASPNSEVSRQEAIKDALLKLRTEPKTMLQMDERVKAIKKLGEMRAVEAIPPLVRNLTKIRPISGYDMLDLAETYPAGEALIQIGDPAVDSLKKRFEATPPGHDQLLILNILRRIKGKEWTVSYLTQLNQEQKEKLPDAALDKLAHWVRSFDGK